MTTAEETRVPMQWEQSLQSKLRLFGHRNWIVIADSAYPAQANTGIETIVAGGDQLEAIERVLQAIASAKHVSATVYTDAELDFVDESDAPGVTNYRTHLRELLIGTNSRQLEHELIIAKLDQSAEVFQVLIIKTDLTIPYTSIFLELECGYWNSQAEQRLRNAIYNQIVELAGEAR